MNILPSQKKAKPTPAVQILSHWEVPEHRRLRGKKYNAAGKFLGETGPNRRVDPIAQRAVRDAYAAAAKMKRPEEGGVFDLKNFVPLPGRVLLKRPPQITSKDGILLPENKWQSECWFFVIKVGAGVTNCVPGDRVIFARTSRPKAVRLGGPFHMGRATAIAGTVDLAI